jgi:hypothetical protein
MHNAPAYDVRGGIRSNLNEEVKRQTAASHAEADQT